MNINNYYDIIHNDIIHNDIINNYHINNQRLNSYNRYNHLLNILNDMIHIITISQKKDIKSREHFLLFLNTSNNLLANNYENINNMSLDKIAYALTYICGTLKKFMYAFDMHEEYRDYSLLDMFRYI